MLYYYPLLIFLSFIIIHNSCYICNYNHTVLMKASQLGYYEVNLLLTVPQFVIKVKTKDNVTALMNALIYDHHDVL